MASAKVLILDLADTLTTAGRLHGDALPFLENARKQYKLILISNSSQRDIEDLLMDYNIDRYFDLVLSAAEFEMKKPDPRIINTSIALLKDKTGESILKENVILIGDRPDTDIKAGNLAGIKTIRIRRGSFAHNDPDFSDEQPKVEFRNLDEVADYLGILAAQPEPIIKQVEARPKAAPEKKRSAPKKKSSPKKAAKKPAKKKVSKKASSKKGKKLFGNFL